MPVKLDRCVKKVMGQGKSKSDAFAICQATQNGDIKAKEKNDWRHGEFSAPINESFLNNQNEVFIKGVAINETTTRNGITYISEELEKVAPSFRNKPLLADHNNSIFSIVGRTTENVNFERSMEGKGRIMFEAKVMDKKVQEMINDGRIQNVSIGTMLEDLKEDEEAGTVTAIGMHGLEISVVAVPGDPGAGLSSALSESLKLKESCGKLNLETNDMAEEDGADAQPNVEQPETPVETPKVEEPVEEPVAEPEAEQSSDDSSDAEEKLKIVEAKLAKYEAKEQAEKFKLAVAEEVKKQIKEQAIPSVKATPIKNETQGKVGTSVDESTEKCDFEFERAESGKGFSIWKDYTKDEACKFKRLYRG
jgi:hypothetical protein